MNELSSSMLKEQAQKRSYEAIQITNSTTIGTWFCIWLATVFAFASIVFYNMNWYEYYPTGGVSIQTGSSSSKNIVSPKFDPAKMAPAAGPNHMKQALLEQQYLIKANIQ